MKPIINRGGMVAVGVGVKFAQCAGVLPFGGIQATPHIGAPFVQSSPALLQPPLVQQQASAVGVAVGVDVAVKVPVAVRVAVGGRGVNVRVTVAVGTGVGL